MLNVSNISPDRYDKKTPNFLKNNIQNKHLLNSGKTKIDPDYHISRKIQQHILSASKKNSNQSIKFLDSNLYINTRAKYLTLQLSFIINNQLFNPKEKYKQNYKFHFTIHLATFTETEGVFENLDKELFLDITRITKIISEHAQKKSMHILEYGLNKSLLKEIMDTDNDQFLNYITNIISIINAKGKYLKTKPETGGYTKKSTDQKNHIPFFKFEKKDIKIKLHIEQPPFLTQDEKISPPPKESFNFFKNFLSKIVANRQNMNSVNNNTFENSILNNPVLQSIKSQLSGLAQGDFSSFTVSSLTSSLGIIFVLITILVILLAILIK